MTAIDTWIADLRATKISQFSQPLESPVDDAVAALQQIQAGLAPAGNEVRNTFFAGPAAGAPALPTFRALVNADFPSTLSPSITGLALTGALSFSGDTGLSRGGVANVFVGNGAAGDFSGTLTATTLATVTLTATVALLSAGVQGGALTSFDNTGAFISLAGGGAGLLAEGRTNNPTLTIQGAAAQTADLLDVNINGGASLASISNVGRGVFGGGVTVGTTTLLTSSVALTDNHAANAGTLTNAPAVGNPTKWIPINDNGTVRNIPAW